MAATDLKNEEAIPKVPSLGKGVVSDSSRSVRVYGLCVRVFKVACLLFLAGKMKKSNLLDCCVSARSHV
jgi:hypothetical protein